MSKQQKDAQTQLRDSAIPSGGDYGKSSEEKEKSKKERDKGEVIRVSRNVLNYIRRKQKNRESVDATLRRLFGLANRKGETPALRTYFVLTQPVLSVFSSAADARGASVMNAVKGKKKKAEAPTKVREVV